MDEIKYTQEQWERLLEASIVEIRRLATLKGGEYAGDVDRLANFRRNAAKLELLPEQVWAVYAGKHWDAVQQYCLDLGKGRERPRAESIAGRLDDLIVYALLMKAMVEEREAPAPSGVTLRVTEITGQFPDLDGRGGFENRKTYDVVLPQPHAPYTPGPRQAIAMQPEPSPQRPRILDPQCPGTGEAHCWVRMDRYTDTCVGAGCGVMRPHERRR